MIPRAQTRLEAALYFTVNGKVTGCFASGGCAPDLTIPPNTLSASVNGTQLYTKNGGDMGTPRKRRLLSRKQMCNLL